jgi:DNA (cytosine-5)-methyltransferase 1
VITVSDFFCGAGGSSTGAVQVPGVSVAMAANHWQLAVDTHNTNHPNTRHDIADLSQVDPRRYPRTDIAWLSPSCTNHSIANGKKRHVDATPDLFGEVLPDEAADRSRATMWDVIRFAEHHRYRAIVVENVVDAKEWVLWPAWSAALTALGYDFRVVSLNSMHAQALGPGAPQSRDRLYVVAWRRGERAPDLDKWTRPMADCSVHGRVRAIQGWKNPSRTVGKYRSQYLWRCPRAECRHEVVEPSVRPAADAIDWSLPAVRIGERAKPLAEKTMRRIRDGFRAYARALLVPAGGTWNDTAYPVTDPMRTRTTRETEGVAVPPLMVPVEGREGKRARTAAEPLRTCTARNETGVAIPPYVVELRGGGSTHRPVTDPLATVCASGNHHGLTVPNLIAPYYGSSALRPAGEPIPTVTTVDRHALLEGGRVSSVEDLGFRMLSPDEYRAAMEFPSGYVLLGNKREKVRLAGNAVTPPAARDLVASLVEALTGDPIDLAA